MHFGVFRFYFSLGVFSDLFSAYSVFVSAMAWHFYIACASVVKLVAHLNYTHSVIYVSDWLERGLCIKFIM